MKPSIFRLAALLFTFTYSTTAQKIPEVQGETFSGAHVDLSQSLPGKAAVLVLGFNQASRTDATAWGKKLAADYYDSPDVLYYEMPVLASVPKLLRGFVTGRIRSSVSDRGKVHFLALYSDEDTWRNLTHYSTPNAAYLLLIDGHGNIRWHTQGHATDSSYAALKQHIDSLLVQNASASAQ